MEIREIESVIEAILFASGDPVSLEKISEILEIDKKTTKSIMINMVSKFKSSGRGIMIREIKNGYQLCSKSEHYEFIKKLFVPRHKQGLSQAAYETLAVVAYKEPVTRSIIEKIRGVNSDSSLTRLLERNLVEEAGRMDAPGRPVLYRTTEEFLRCFGFKSLKDLPAVELNREDIEDVDLDIEQQS